MTTHATGTYEGKTWDEQPYGEVSGGPKLTHVIGTNAFHGDVEGEGTVEDLMFYDEPTHCTYFGLERVVGRVDGHVGSFVLRHEGTWEKGMVQGNWSVVPGSGTGDLRGLQGKGGFVWREGEAQTRFTLDYDLGR